MSELLKLLSEILKQVTDFIPRIIVISRTSKWVKNINLSFLPFDLFPSIICWWKKRNKRIKVVEWVTIYWPIFTEFIEYPIVRQTKDLPSQTFTLSNCINIVIKAVVVFEIDDIVKAVNNNYAVDTSIRDISMSWIKRLIYSVSEWDLLTKEIKVSNDINDYIKKELQKFWVKLLEIHIVDISEVKNIKLHWIDEFNFNWNIN